MIQALSKDEYWRVLPLLGGSQPNYFDIIARAVVAGNSPGSIWVDDASKPKSSLIRDKHYCFYLVGDPDNEAFNAALRNLVTEQIAPEALATGQGIFKLFYSTLGWESKVESIFNQATLTIRGRTLFTLDHPTLPDWRAKLPAAAVIRPIDRELLTSTNLQGLQSIVSEMLSTWASLDDFLALGFGYCLVYGERIACWCTAEYVDGKAIGVGIETVEQHWGKGFATLTAAAFVEHCTAHGIAAYWDAWTSNVASRVVAEKVGFKKMQEYSIYFGTFEAIS